jgi:hypothetical protein
MGGEAEMGLYFNTDETIDLIALVNRRFDVDNLDDWRVVGKKNYFSGGSSSSSEANPKKLHHVAKKEKLKAKTTGPDNAFRAWLQHLHSSWVDVGDAIREFIRAGLDDDGTNGKLCSEIVFVIVPNANTISATATQVGPNTGYAQVITITTMPADGVAAFIKKRRERAAARRAAAAKRRKS